MSQDPQNSGQVQILLDDPDFFILYKPCGVISSLEMQKPNSLLRLIQKQGLGDFPGLVHRIDTPAEGLMLWAKNKPAVEFLSRLFREGKILKRYWLVIPQGLEPPEGEWTDKIWHDRRSNKAFVVPAEHKTGKKAVLSYRVVSRGDRFDLVEVDLITGRTHQIRVQFSHRDFPLRGDLKYGARRSQKGGGIGLLSHELAFSHPKTGQPISVICPLPDQGLWKALSGHQ